MACLCLLPCSPACLGSKITPVLSYTPSPIVLNKCCCDFLTSFLVGAREWHCEARSHRPALCIVGYTTLPVLCIWLFWAPGSSVSFTEIQGDRSLVFPPHSRGYISEIPLPSYFETVSKKRKEQRCFHSTIWKPEDLLELNVVLKSVF